MFDEIEVLERFDAKNVDDDTLERIAVVRAAYKATAQFLLDTCESGRSLALALTHLEDSANHAVKSLTHE